MQESARKAALGSASAPQEETETAQGGQKLLAAGSVLAALGATSCCVLPLVLITLGASGAWIGNLASLAPYQPYFIAAALAFVAFGFWRVYRRPTACADGSACGTPRSNRTTKVALWAAAVLVLLAVTFPYTAPLLF